MLEQVRAPQDSIEAPRRFLVDGEVSIELAPDQVRDFQPDPTMLPLGSRIFLPHLQGKPLTSQLDAARHLIDMNYRPVPHFGARNFEHVDDFVRMVSEHSRNGVVEGLFLGGNPEVASGPLPEAAALLRHPVVKDSAIKVAFLAGYPEGHPNISAESLAAAASTKIAICREKGVQPRIVSQFAFDGKVVAAWADRVRNECVDVPIHIGLAGVTSLPKLIKYAAMCGIGPSLAALKRTGKGLLNVLADKDPADVIKGIEENYAGDVGALHLHLFPFGGWRKTVDWVARSRSA
jgi:methylenetetrahydrofolate reductase (NADPH)